jgi:hypothetical protein
VTKTTLIKQNLLFTIICFAQCLFVCAQDSKEASARAQSIYGELGGNGVFLSLNYDTRFSSRNNGLGGRAGVGFVPGFSFGFGSVSTTITFPIGLNYLVGNGPNYLEAGAGATIISGAMSIFGAEAKATSVGFVPSVGYRYQPLTRGFTGRVVISPFIGNGVASFWAGISAGVRF